MGDQTQTERMARALIALDGLSVGDAFGERFFSFVLRDVVIGREVPAPPWSFTDDTQMALSIVDTLRERGEIDQEYLAVSLAYGFHAGRGYGAAMPRLLKRIRDGENWRNVAPKLFNGSGSYGNGSAMRVAPVGAFYADDLWAAAAAAALSAPVTHANPEAMAGAVAVAVAAGLAWQCRNEAIRPSTGDFIGAVIPYVPRSEVLNRLIQARSLHPRASVELAVAALGNGIGVTCQDTVPFAIWSAAQQLDNYEEALWRTVSAGGDIDTNCAIVGGIVAMYTGREGIPADWLAAREPLPEKPEPWLPDFE